MNNIVNFNQTVWQGVTFVNQVLNEAYNYEVLDIRFLFCMNLHL